MADRPGNPALRRTAARAKLDQVVLPRAGNTDPVPDPPADVDLGGHGAAWWRWAWTTPESTQWADPYQVVRRAQLEDMFQAGTDRARCSSEMRQLEKQLGLTAEAKKSLGWVMEPEDEAPRNTGAPTPAPGGGRKVGSLDRARAKREARSA